MKDLLGKQQKETSTANPNSVYRNTPYEYTSTVGLPASGTIVLESSDGIDILESFKTFPAYKVITVFSTYRLHANH